MPVKYGISGQKGVNRNYDKNLIHLPRQSIKREIDLEL